MSQIILGQVQFILIMLCCGMGTIAGYDVLRLFRWLVPHAGLAVLLEDLLYWSAGAIPVFYLFFLFHDGEIRWYGIVSILLGIFLYEYGLSRPARRWLSGKADPVRRRIRRLVRQGVRAVRGKVRIWKQTSERKREEKKRKRMSVKKD